MPNAPDKRDQHDAFEIPERKSGANHYKENRRTNEAPSEALKQSAIAIVPNHSRQVMADCAEASAKEINVLRTPQSLSSYENRDYEQRSTNAENQVSPT